MHIELIRVFTIAALVILTAFVVSQDKGNYMRKVDGRLIKAPFVSNIWFYLMMFLTLVFILTYII